MPDGVGFRRGDPEDGLEPVRRYALAGRLQPLHHPGMGGPDSEGFAALRLKPWRLRVFPGSVLIGGGDEVLNWRGRCE